MPGRDRDPLEPIGATGKFPRTARVRHRREFARIQDGGIRVHTDAFTIIAIRNDAGRARLGCTISRRVGNAVVRNRIRRLLKETFRRRAKELPSIDLVVVAKPKAGERADDDFESVQRELSEGFVKAVKILARREAAPPDRGES